MKERNVYSKERREELPPHRLHVQHKLSLSTFSIFTCLEDCRSSGSEVILGDIALDRESQ